MDGSQGEAGGVDLDSMTVGLLTALIAAAEAKIHEKQEAAQAALLAKWRKEAAEHNLPFDKILARHQAGPVSRKKPATADKLPVKFKGPKREEWTGRGKIPKWLEDAEKQGRNREEFSV